MNQDTEHSTSRRGFFETCVRGIGAVALVGLVFKLGLRRPADCKITRLCEQCPVLTRCGEPAAVRARRS